MTIEKFHQYAIWVLIILCTLAFAWIFFTSNTLDEAALFQIFMICLCGFSIYVPIYALYANKQGSIHFYYTDIEKQEKPIRFRLAQMAYLAFSLLFFMASLVTLFSVE
ncbi:MAG: hypothetical protein AAF512_08515 [Pseudomonadota bacterium]